MAAKNVRLGHANSVGATKWGEACRRISSTSTSTSKIFERGMGDDDDVELRWKKVVKQLYGRLVRRKSDRLQSMRLEKQHILSAAWRNFPNAFGQESVIFEDEHLIAVNKPAGFGNEAVLATLVGLLEKQSCIQGLKLRIVQRLAEDTSGLLLVTKSSQIYDAMIQTPVRTRFIALAAAADDLPSFGSLLLESGYARLSSHKKYVWPISEAGSKEGICRVEKIATRFDIVGFRRPDASTIDTIASSKNSTRTKLVVETSSTQPMYRRIEDHGGRGGEALLRICPTTQFGDHQVRLHCEYLGLPILGDFEYGGPLRWNGVAHKTFTLHAASIRFRHPMKSEELMNLGAPLPDWAACFGDHQGEPE